MTPQEPIDTIERDRRARELIDTIERDHRADIASDHLTWVEIYCLHQLDDPEPRHREHDAIGRTMGVRESIVDEAITSAYRKLAAGAPVGIPSRERWLRQQSNQLRWGRMLTEEKARREGLKA